MRRWIPAACLAAAVFAVAGCGGDSEESGGTAGDTSEETTHDAAEGALTGSVGPGFVISMGQTEASAGTYTLTVDDKASSHNFHLTGPGGVDVSTDVGGSGKETFTVTLRAGTYTFVCDPHSSSMNGTLTVSE